MMVLKPWRVDAARVDDARVEDLALLQNSQPLAADHRVVTLAQRLLLLTGLSRTEEVHVGHGAVAGEAADADARDVWLRVSSSGCGGGGGVDGGRLMVVVGDLRSHLSARLSSEIRNSELLYRLMLSLHSHSWFMIKTPAPTASTAAAARAKKHICKS